MLKQKDESVKFLHIECDCETQLYYVGGNHNGERPVGHIASLKRKLGRGNYFVFCSVDGVMVTCPNCDNQYRFPESRFMNWVYYQLDLLRRRWFNRF